MKIFDRVKIERVKIICEETEKDKKKVLHWLFENGYMPTRREVLHKYTLYRLTHKGKFIPHLKVKEYIKPVKSMFVVVAERRI